MHATTHGSLLIYTFSLKGGRSSSDIIHVALLLRCDEPSYFPSQLFVSASGGNDDAGFCII